MRSSIKGEKYYLDLQKAVKRDGNFYVQGIAGGTSFEDVNNEPVDKQVIERFVRHINEYTLPLTNGHQYEAGAIDDDLGVVYKAEILQKGKDIEMFIEAELDMDNPNSQYLVKALDKGKKLSFSIDGIQAVQSTIYDDDMNTYVTKFIDAIPQAISVTPRPSYEPSFMEVLQKSTLTKATYTGYPQSAVNNAKKVLEWKDKHGSEVKGMTETGWARARQIAARKPISRDDLGSIASFKRHEKNSKIAEENRGTPWKDAGHVAWLGWGGASMINWASDKLNSLQKTKMPGKHKIKKAFSKGDNVSWNSSGGRARGVIREIRTSGTFTPDNSTIELKAQEDDPVYVIELLDNDGNPRGQKVGHKQNALSRLDKSYNKKTMEKTKEKKKLTKSEDTQVEETKPETENIEETQTEVVESDTVVEETEAKQSEDEVSEESETVEDKGKTTSTEEGEVLQKTAKAETVKLQKSVSGLYDLVEKLQDEMNSKFESINEELNKPLKKSSKVGSYDDVKKSVEKTDLRSKLERFN